MIGAGFAGLRALHTLRGAGHRVAALEAAAGIGGALDRLAANTRSPEAQAHGLGDEILGRPRRFMLYSGGLRNDRHLITEVAAGGCGGFAWRR